MPELPDKANVVIIGGGVIGCSIAYHLAKLGFSDVVLLERQQLTSGTTWHAAGLVGQLRTSINMTKLAKYTSELYRGLEDETGQVNLVLWNKIAEKYRAALLNARLLGVAGELQIEGQVMHVIARELFDHSELLGDLSVVSRDFR